MKKLLYIIILACMHAVVYQSAAQSNIDTTLWLKVKVIYVDKMGDGAVKIVEPRGHWVGEANTVKILGIASNYQFYRTSRIVIGTTASRLNGITAGNTYLLKLHRYKPELPIGGRYFEKDSVRVYLDTLRVDPTFEHVLKESDNARYKLIEVQPL